MPHGPTDGVRACAGNLAPVAEPVKPAGGAMTEPSARYRRWAWLAGVGFEALLLVLALFLGWLLEIAPLESLRPVVPAVVWGGVATIPPLIGLRVVTASAWPPFARLTAEVDRTLGPLLQDRSWLELAVLALVAGLGEEALFRGVIQPALSAWSGVGVGLVLTSVLFGLAHAVTPTYAVLATAMGLYLGALTIVFGSLTAPVTVHAVYDFVALGYLVRIRAAGRAPSSLPPGAPPSRPASADPGPP